MPLSTLVDDVPQILTKWPTEPVLSHRAPESFADLLRIEEIDALIDADCLAARNVVLLKDGKVLERHTYIDGEMPRPGVIRAHIDRGGTLSVRQLQTIKPSLRRLRDEIQQETGCQAHVNAYMTPPGSQGLTYHYDPYVTLIVQLAGSKAWPIHRPFVENPMTEHGNFLGRGFTPEERHFLAHTPPAATYTLRPGDVFWLPRGHVHAPYTVGEETSLHLTFALKERTLYWLARTMTEEITAQALADPALRAAITPKALLTEPGEALEWTRAYVLGSLLLLPPEHMGELIRKAATGDVR